MEIVEKKNIGDYVPVTMVDPKLPKILDTLLARMLAKEPRHRYQTVSELIVELERSAAGRHGPQLHRSGAGQARSCHPPTPGILDGSDVHAGAK